MSSEGPLVVWRRAIAAGLERPRSTHGRGRAIGAGGDPGGASTVATDGRRCPREKIGARSFVPVVGVEAAGA